ncbi:MAG: hypothetical protein ACJ76B_08815 [Solirubrobacterales bacterium]
MRTVTPGKISNVTMKELSAVLAECAARTEVARAGVEEARKGIEEARKKQEEATAEQKALTIKLDKQRAAADARWERERVEMREYHERQEKFMKEHALQARAILAELKEHRDERRAMIEAIFRVLDRLDGQTRSS